MSITKKKYAPPETGSVTVVPLEASLLVDSAIVNNLFNIEGQSVDGYFEDDDLSTDWGWD